MSQQFDETQVLQRVARLTRDKLTALMEAGAIFPDLTESGPLFVAADVARLDLLCEFEELFDMKPEALAVMITVIDQMHAARQDRRCLLEAIGTETVDVQMRIATVLAEVSPRTK